MILPGAFLAGNTVLFCWFALATEGSRSLTERMHELEALPDDSALKLFSSGPEVQLGVLVYVGYLETRVQVYEWRQTDDVENRALVGTWRQALEPSLSGFTDETDGELGEQVDILADFIDEHVPHDKQQATEVAIVTPEGVDQHILVAIKSHLANGHQFKRVSIVNLKDLRERDDLASLEKFDQEIDYEDAYQRFDKIDVPDEQADIFGTIIAVGRLGTRVSVYNWTERARRRASGEHFNEVPEPQTRTLWFRQRDLESKPQKVEALGALLVAYISTVVGYSNDPQMGFYVSAPSTLEAQILEAIGGNLDTTLARQDDPDHLDKAERTRRKNWARGEYPVSLGGERGSGYAMIEVGEHGVDVMYKLAPGLEQEIEDQLSGAGARQAYRERVVSAPVVDAESGKEIKGVKEMETIFSVTFRGFGTRKMREAYDDLLIRHYKNKEGWHKLTHKSKCFLHSCLNGYSNLDDTGHHIYELNDPCMPSGYVSELMRKPRRQISDPLPKNILGYQVIDDEPSFSYRIRGTGSYSRCRSRLQNLLRLAKRERFGCKTSESESTCAVDLLGELFIPYKSIEILATGELQFAASLMDEESADEHYDHFEVQTQARELCKSHYTKLVEDYDKHQREDSEAELIDKSELSMACFRAVWADLFLIEALRMPYSYQKLQTYVES